MNVTVNDLADYKEIVYLLLSLLWRRGNLLWPGYVLSSMPVLPCPYQLHQVLFNKYLVQQHIHFFEMLCKLEFTLYFPKAVILTPRHLNNFSSPPIYSWYWELEIPFSFVFIWTLSKSKFLEMNLGNEVCKLYWMASRIKETFW